MPFAGVESEMFSLHSPLAGLLATIPMVAYLAMQALFVDLLPSLVYGAVSRKTTLRVRTLCVAMLATTWLPGWFQPLYATRLAVLHLGILYYLGVSFVIYRLEPHVYARALSRRALAALLLSLSLVLPSFLFRRVGLIPLLAFGWYIMLGAYSYCLDARKNGSLPSGLTVIKFLMVERSLVFPLRAHHTSIGASKSLGRAVCGVLMVIGGNFASKQVADFAQIADLGNRPPWEPVSLGLLTLIVALAGLTLFWVRAGTAHAHIGLLAYLGVSAREAFNRPYFASSPLDFWRRWNMWAGEWARRYVFMPCTLMLRRTSAEILQSWATALSILATFLVIGLLHDILPTIAKLDVHTHYSGMFLFSAVVLLAWEAVALYAGPTVRGKGLMAMWKFFARPMLLTVYVFAMLRMV